MHMWFLVHIFHGKSTKPFFFQHHPKIRTRISGKLSSFIVFQCVAMVIHLQAKSIGCAISEEPDLRDSRGKPRALYYTSHCFRQSLIFYKACSIEALVTCVCFYFKQLLTCTCIMEQWYYSTFQLLWFFSPLLEMV